MFTVISINVNDPDNSLREYVRKLMGLYKHFLTDLNAVRGIWDNLEMVLSHSLSSRLRCHHIV